MKKKILFITLAGLIFTISPIFAITSKIPMDLSTPGTEKTLVLPPTADHSSVISLGNAIDPQTGKMVEGYAIVHYKDNNAKSNPAKGKSVVCYGFLASGAKWKTLEPWAMNPANTRGLDLAAVFNNESYNITKWENATGVDILGNGTSTSTELVADTLSPDGLNEVYFGSIQDNNAIAITIVWGIFGGKTTQRYLAEWDQVFDEIDYDWSLSETGVAGKMDFENISTHELGHSVGMNDLYNTCANETMYGYASNGETIKRDLNTGDIIGINQLY